MNIKNKHELLAAIASPRGFNGRDLDVLIINALGGCAAELRNRWGVYNSQTGRWEALPFPRSNLDDAVRLVTERGLDWELSTIGKGGYHGSVAGKAPWSAGTPAAALTRALVAHVVGEGWTP